MPTHADIIEGVMEKSKTLIASAIILLVIIGFYGAVFAAATPSEIENPQLPQRFYGEVTIRGIPAPAGVTVTAVAGDDSSSVVTKVPGRYGSVNLLGEKLLVQGAHIPIDTGTPVFFSINGASARCFDVGTGRTLDSYPFESDRNTELNLDAEGGLDFTIISSAGPHGTITPSGAVTVAFGNNATFTIHPDKGFFIDDVTVDGRSVGAIAEYSFTDVRSDHTIHAEFVSLHPPTLFIEATAGLNGTITPSGEVEVLPGTDQTFTISPDPGFLIDDVLVDGATAGPVAQYTFTNVTANHTIHASFSEGNLTLTITATSGPNGTINPSGTVIVEPGSSKTFEMVADSGFRVGNVIVDGTPVGPAVNYTFSGVITNHTIHAEFLPAEAQTFLISATAGPDGTISPSGLIEVSSGANQTFIISPASGFSVADVRVDNVSIGAVGTYTFNNITANHTIAAAFGIGNFSIMATAGPNGTIIPSGVVTVTAGQNQSFTITPDAGFVIGGLLIDNVTVEPATNFTFGNVSANHTIAASFSTAVNYTIVATKEGSGSISPSGNVSISAGSDITFNITPDAGFLVQNIFVDGVSSGALNQWTFTHVLSNHTIHTVFGAAGGGGGGSGGGGGGSGGGGGGDYGDFFGPPGPGTTGEAAPPVANFSADPRSGQAPLDVFFRDNSTGSPTNWSWDFGDGTGSTEQHPVHRYETPGDYNVTLQVSNTAGSGRKTEENFILVKVVPEEPLNAAFTASPRSGTAPLTVEFGDRSGGTPVSWSWDFGDGGSSGVQNPSYTYRSPGSYNVSLTVSDINGSSTLAEPGYIVVSGPPVTGVPFWKTIPLSWLFAIIVLIIAFFAALAYFYKRRKGPGPTTTTAE